ncbi:MAG: hypothetical protein ACI9SB_001199 [Candidatus Azotimanducaceae bacterium]|jgi:hypothetical protein
MKSLMRWTAPLSGKARQFVGKFDGKFANG